MNISQSPEADFDRFWDYNRPEETEHRFHRLLSLADREEISYTAELLTQIARAQGLQRKFAEAHRTLDEAQGLLTDDYPRARVRYLLERGRVFNSSNEPSHAQPLFREAWEHALEAGEEYYAIDAAHMLGIAAPPDERLAWNLQALQRAESTSDARAAKWLGSLYNNIGWTYHDRGDYDLAMEMFQKAQRFREQQGDEEATLIARWCVARTLRSLGRVTEALAAQQALLHAREARGESAPYVAEELGECLLLLDRADEARPFFAQTYALLSQDPWLVAEEPARLERLQTLAG